MHLMEGHI